MEIKWDGGDFKKSITDFAVNYNEKTIKKQRKNNHREKSDICGETILKKFVEKG